MKTPTMAIHFGDPLDRAHRRPRAKGHEQDQEGFGIVEAEHTSTATGVRASTAPARRPAAAVLQRFTVAWTTPTVATPMMTSGRRIEKELNPKIRTDSAITQREAGGLSTVIELPASELPKKAFHDWLPADCGGVEAVRPAIAREADDVEGAGGQEQSKEGRPRPRRVGVRSAPDPAESTEGEAAVVITRDRRSSCHLCCHCVWGMGLLECGPSEGSQTVKTVRPGSLARSTRPACAPATAATMDNPSPVDPEARLRESSPRVKRSKTRGCRSAGIPGPLSATSMRTC